MALSESRIKILTLRCAQEGEQRRVRKRIHSDPALRPGPSYVGTWYAGTWYVGTWHVGTWYLVLGMVVLGMLVLGNLVFGIWD